MGQHSEADVLLTAAWGYVVTNLTSNFLTLMRRFNLLKRLISQTSLFFAEERGAERKPSFQLLPIFVHRRKQSCWVQFPLSLVEQACVTCVSKPAFFT